VRLLRSRACFAKLGILFRAKSRGSISAIRMYWLSKRCWRTSKIRGETSRISGSCDSVSLEFPSLINVESVTLGSTFARTVSSQARRSMIWVSRSPVTAAPTEIVTKGERCCRKPGLHRTRKLLKMYPCWGPDCSH